MFKVYSNSVLCQVRRWSERKIAGSERKILTRVTFNKPGKLLKNGLYLVNVVSCEMNHPSSKHDVISESHQATKLHTIPIGRGVFIISNDWDGYRLEFTKVHVGWGYSSGDVVHGTELLRVVFSGVIKWLMGAPPRKCGDQATRIMQSWRSPSYVEVTDKTAQRMNAVYLALHGTVE